VRADGADAGLPAAQQELRPPGRDELHGGGSLPPGEAAGDATHRTRAPERAIILTVEGADIIPTGD
jgi:hypothetical protein